MARLSQEVGPNCCQGICSFALRKVADSAVLGEDYIPQRARRRLSGLIVIATLATHCRADTIRAPLEMAIHPTPQALAFNC